jgi:uncharacterized protein involved in exopolysaccharide biosynthesis
MTAVKQEKYLDLGDFILVCWAKKWLIIAITTVFAVSAIYLALSMPNQYKAEALLAPSEEQQGGGLAALASQFGGLASLAGINLPGKSGDKTLLTLEVFRSRQFLMGFIDRHNLKVPLMAVKEWDAKTGELIYNEKIYDVANKKWVRDVTFPKMPEPTTFEVYEELKERFSMDREELSGTVLVSLEYYSPVLAKEWLTMMVADLNSYMREVEQRESKRSIEYLQEQIDKSDVAEVRNLFYQLIQEQIQKAMLAEARDEFVYKTIDGAIVPEKKSKPSRAVIVILVTMMGGIFSVLLVHLLHSRDVNRRFKAAQVAEAA